MQIKDPEIVALFARMQQGIIDAQAEREKNNPLTRIFNCKGGISWWYQDAYRMADGTRVRVCRSKRKNIAGYYLTWVERGRRGGERTRTQYVAHKTRNSARAMVERWADDFRKEHEMALPKE